MNPFKQKSKSVEDGIVDWKTMASKPYNKNTVDPYTKLRIILCNGAEFESVWFQHQFMRHCQNDDLRRELAMLRRVEQQQQKRIGSMKPLNETILETTIGYEMLAVDLTSALAKQEKCALVKKALDFALLEDFDHLYRYSNLLEGERGIKAEKLVGKYVEIMPGRPTISEHRYPFDDVRPCVSKDADLLTKVNIGIITAAEQQTMNYYMNIGAFYDTEAGRSLYAEIAMIEEQHVSHYGSLINTDTTWLEGLLMHEYTECYLYYSCFSTETCEKTKALWEQLYEQELSHLKKAAELLEKYEKKQVEQVIPKADFPKLLKLEPSKEYVREVMQSTRLTSKRDDYINVAKLEKDDEFFKFQDTVNPTADITPSHKVIKNYIEKNKKDYRYAEAPHPINALDCRTKDNISVARCKEGAEKAQQ
ncbi:MAG: hypothetical protein RR902_01290 [Oscillospiraceae bacterium]